MNDRGSRDDFERIRLKMAGQKAPADNLAGQSSPVFVGQVTSSGTSIAIGKFLMVQPYSVMGQEVEGGSGQFASISSTGVPVYLLGPGLPANGDFLVCKYVDNRWVAERMTTGSGGGDYVIVAGCYCQTIPPSLSMASADPTCNYGMFQSCQIEYGPTPAEFEALQLGKNCFLSSASFPDALSGGASFRYYLSCLGNQFNLTRVYAESPFGSPYIDGILYSWLVGAYGNSCTPFQLDNGTAFPGSDASCSVTING